MSLEVAFQRLHPDAVVPTSPYDGDAGLDLASVERCEIAPGARRVVATGLAVAIPQGHAGFVQPRSGLAARHGISVVNSPGLIDSGYRGELMVLLVNTDPTSDYEVNVGDRIAQLVIQPVEQATFVAVDELDDHERGEGGFGSTGRA